MKERRSKRYHSRIPLGTVCVRNFKAVRDSGLVSFSPLTVFIGNNGSGKSSIIEALETVQTIALEGLDEAFTRWRGFEHVWNKAITHTLQEDQVGHQSPANPMSFEISGFLQQIPFQGSFEISTDNSGNQVEIIRQGLSTSVDQDNIEEPKFTLEKSIWRDIVKSWQFLSLNPQAMQYPQLQHRSHKNIMLSRDGANIAQYLQTITDQDPSILQSIAETLHTVLPYASGVRAAFTRELERSVYVQLIEEGIDDPLVGWLLSQGTLRLMGLLAVLRHPQPPSVVFIEELENGLDPRSIHLIIEEIRLFVKAGGQIIATTHSPYLLDLVDLSHIVLVERTRSGAPVFRRPSKTRLKGWSDKFAPGRLYTMGNLIKDR